MLLGVDLALSLAITLVVAVVAVVAVSVAVVPIVITLVSEHRNLHGEARTWLRRHGRKPESLLDVPRMYNQTSEEKHQELV